MNRSWRRLIHAIFGAAVIGGGFAPLLAQERSVSVEELTRNSEVVAVGKVRQKKSAWVGKGERIETTVTLDVSEYVKGGGSGTIEVTTPGGEVGGVGELYTHSARFEKDEEVVVFARRDRNNRYQVAGGSSGRQKVTTDPATGEKHAGGKPLTDYVSGLKKAARGNQ
jgi:hypothetical protein